MLAYLDSSALLRRILKQENAITDFSQYQQIVSSRLLRVECLRTFDRMRLHAKIDYHEILPYIDHLDRTLEYIHLVAISEQILDRAEQAFPSNLGTLDAIHLSTAILWQIQAGQQLTFLTHDKELSLAARSCGFQCLGT